METLLQDLKFGAKLLWKEKAFAASVNRDHILECEKLGIPLDEFIQISVDAMREIAGEIGL